MRTKKTVLEHLKDISENHTHKRIKFSDGSMTVDAWTANTMLCVFNAINEENKVKFKDKIESKSGFMQLANFSYKNTKVKS